MILVQLFWFICFFFITPMGLGRIFTYRCRIFGGKSLVMQYIVGFFAFLGFFSVISIPATVFAWPFHILQYVLIGMVILAFVVCAADLATIQGRQRVSLWMRDSLHIIKKYWWILLPVGVVLFQICRVVIKRTCVYSDDAMYMSVIIDMIKTDIILGTDPVSGVIKAGSNMANSKLTLSGWVQLLAAMTSVCGMHPLIFVKTLSPVFLIGFHYLIVWKLTSCLADSYSRRGCMLLFYTLLMEFGSISLRTDFSYYLLTWSWYGKSFYQFAAIPVYLVYFLMTRKKQVGWREGLILFVLSLGGLGASTTAVILMPIEIGLLTGLECLGERSLRRIVTGIPAALPVAVIALMYVTMF